MGDELSLPILWADSGGRALPGRLDLSPERLQLDAGARDERRTREIPLAEILSVRIGRRSHERLRGRPALLVELRDGSLVAVAVLGGLGGLRDLGERLWTLTGAGPEPESA
jgi:hypothetical protein